MERGRFTMDRSFCSVLDAQIFDSSATKWQGWRDLTAPNQEPDARIIGPDARVKSLGNTFVNVLSEADIGLRRRARKRSHSFSGVMTHAQQAISQAILLKASQSPDGRTAIGSLSDGEELCFTPLGGMQSRDPQSATTMMIRNIPQRITQMQLAKEVDATGFRDTYDFLYLPSNIAAKQGKGYAFVNFATPEAAQAFKTAWHARTRFKMGRTQYGRKKVLDVSVSSLQGKAANLAQWQHGKTNRITNPSFRPMSKELPKSLKLM